MKNHGRRIGIEFISVCGLPPLEFVRLAADLGCQHISMSLSPMPGNPHNYPSWSLRDDARLRRDVVAAMSDCGVSISLGEGFLLMPNADVDAAAPDMDVMRQLGVPLVNVLSLDPDQSRSFDRLASFVEMATIRGLGTTLEFMPGLPVGDLATALAAIRHVGKADFRLLVDAMHFFRSGASIADLAAIAPDVIGYIQLCDVPLRSNPANYAQEARYERLPPGKGELPLFELLCALPRDLSVGLEVPMLGQAQENIGPYQRLSGCVDATRELLARLSK